MDFTAVGPTTNRAARLQGEALPGEAVCVSEATHRVVAEDVVVKEAEGRLVKLKNMGEEHVWDVIGWREGAPR